MVPAAMQSRRSTDSLDEIRTQLFNLTCPNSGATPSQAQFPRAPHGFDDGSAGRISTTGGSSIAASRGQYIYGSYFFLHSLEKLKLSKILPRN
jgi:hypothetical protein